MWGEGFQPCLIKSFQGYDYMGNLQYDYDDLRFDFGCLIWVFRSLILMVFLSGFLWKGWNMSIVILVVMVDEWGGR